MSAARRRIALWGCVGLLTVLLVTALVLQRRLIARSLIDAQLRALGLEEVWQEVERVGPGRFAVRDFRVGRDGDLVIARIDARYSPTSLLAGRLQELVVQGVRLRARIEDGALSFGALDPLLTREAPAAAPAAPPLSLPADVLRVEDVEVDVRTPWGGVSLAVDGRADAAPDGGIAVELRIAAAGALRRQPEPGDPPVPLSLALDVSGTVEGAGPGLRFDFVASSPDERLRLEAAGVRDGGTGEVRVRLLPFALRADAGEAAALRALLEPTLELTAGSVEARGTLRWRPEEPLDGDLDLAIRGLTATSERGSCEGLDAAVRFEGPWPLTTPAGQLLSAARLDLGLALTDGVVEFQLRPQGVLEVASAQWSFAGGTIHTRGAVALDGDSQGLVLDIAGVDLSELLALVDLEGLSGTGIVAGRIPVSRRGGTVAIENGRLEASPEGGWIRYAGQTAGAAAASGDQNLAFAFAALENFHFDGLVATIDGDVSEEVSVSIHLSGANPDTMEGHPFEFNLRVESRLVDLLRNATAVHQMPARIEERIREMWEASR